MKFKDYLNLVQEDVLSEITMTKDSGKLRNEEFINILKQNSVIYNVSIGEIKHKSVKIEENDNSSGFILKFDNGKEREIKNENFTKFAEFKRNKNQKYVDIETKFRNGEIFKFTGSLKAKVI